jgi:hypothetical protein
MSFRHLIKHNASTMPRSQNYLLQSRSPSPPSPLTDLASPTIETAPPSPIEAQSQLCECNTQWQHDFFGCAYSLFPFPSAQPSSFPPSSSGLVGSWARWKLTLNAPLLSTLLYTSTVKEQKTFLTTFQAPSPPLPASQTSLPHSQKAAPHGHRGTTPGPAP